MARGTELELFAREHGLQLVAISDLVAYRTGFAERVERGASAAMPLAAGRFTAVGYRSRMDGGEHVALVHGEIGDGDDVLVHVHRECLAGDILGSTLCGCGEHLRSALACVADEGRGVVVYLRSAHGGAAPSREVQTSRAGEQRPTTVGGRLRDRDVAGEILRDLGVSSTRSTCSGLGRRCRL